MIFMGEKSSLYILSIVCIVAIVGLVVLIITGRTGTESSFSFGIGENSFVGYATVSATCRDTDSGLVYTTKGTISGGTWKTTGASYTAKTDYCDARGKLQEYYCSSNTTAFVSAKNCSILYPGYICKDGTCVNGTTITNVTTINVTNATNATALPDLIITGINFVNINATNNITVNFTIKNQGTADAGYSGILHTTFWIPYTDTDGSSKTSVGTGYQYVSAYYDLKAGESITGKITSGLSSTFVDDIRAGNSHDIGITLSTDWTNHITESDETNNEYTTTVTVTSADIIS